MSLRATHPSACATMASTFLSAAEDARAASSRVSRAAASAVSLAASILSMLSLHAVSRRLARSSSASSAGTRARSAARSSSRSLTAQAASSAARFAAASATAARPLKLTTMPIATPNESVAHINPKRASGASPLVAHAAAPTAMPAPPRAATRPPRALAAAASVDGDTHAKRSATMHADCAAMIAIRTASAAADTDAAAAEDMVRPRNHVPALACAGTSRLVCLCAFCSGGRRGPRAAPARREVAGARLEPPRRDGSRGKSWRPRRLHARPGPRTRAQCRPRAHSAAQTHRAAARWQASLNRQR